MFSTAKDRYSTSHRKTVALVNFFFVEIRSQWQALLRSAAFQKLEVSTGKTKNLRRHRYATTVPVRAAVLQNLTNTIGHKFDSDIVRNLRVKLNKNMLFFLPRHAHPAPHPGDAVSSAVHGHRDGQTR
jgi:hypothetical protein